MMTEDEWMKCTDPSRMWDFLENRAAQKLSHRKEWLFTPGCCRRVWSHLSEDARNAVELLEQYAEGEISWSEFDHVREAHSQALSIARPWEHPELLRDIFGNPFRPVPLDPPCRTPTVVQLAEAIYQERAFDRLPVLADALEDAGCTQADLLAHLRGGGEHVRGCWALDLVTGRK